MRLGGSLLTKPAKKKREPPSVAAQERKRKREEERPKERERRAKFLLRKRRKRLWNAHRSRWRPGDASFFASHQSRFGAFTYSYVSPRKRTQPLVQPFTHPQRTADARPLEREHGCGSLLFHFFSFVLYPFISTPFDVRSRSKGLLPAMQRRLP